MKEFLDKFYEEVVDAVEREASKNNFNAYCLQNFDTIFRLASRDDLIPRLEVVWNKAIEFTNRTDIFRNLRLPLGFLLQFNPLYPTNALPYVITTDEPHIALSLQRKYEEAYQHATTELALEEISATQMVMGDFDAAELTLQRIQTRKSRRDLMFVLIIEKFRRNQMKDVDALLQELRSKDINLYDYMFLLFGFNGREPYLGYPFSDY